jgi:hypothetical protein
MNPVILLAKKQFDTDIAKVNAKLDSLNKRQEQMEKQLETIGAQLDFLERDARVGKYAPQTKPDPVLAELAKVTRDFLVGGGGENPFNRTLHKAAY